MVVQDEAAEVADRLARFEKGGQRGRRVDGNREDRHPDEGRAGVGSQFGKAVGGDFDRKRAAVVVGLDEGPGVGCVDWLDAEARRIERRPRGQVGCAFEGVPLAGDGEVEPGRCER